MSVSDDSNGDEFDLRELNRSIRRIIPIEPLTEEDIAHKSPNEVKQLIKERAAHLYEEKEAEFEEKFPGEEKMRELERVVLLKVIDARWNNHIDDMEQLRQGIGLAAYGQRDPKDEYRAVGSDMFMEMGQSIREETLTVLYHVRLEQKVEREETAKPMSTNREEEAPKKPVVKKAKKIYPNDPCPCGSGKKYKNCHGRPGAAPLD